MKATPPPLPHGAGDPLALHPPGWGLWPWLLALAVAAGVWWLWRRWRARPRPAPAPSPIPAAVPVSGERPTGITSRLSRLEALHLATKTYREGCHALAEALRGWLEEASAPGARAMTAEEIHRHQSQGGLAPLMRRLRDVRFAETEPTEPVFLELFGTARQVVRQKRRKK